jgi:hypothetical protein
LIKAMAKIYCPMELKKAESKLRYAVEMEEELTNVLAKALKNLISSVALKSKFLKTGEKEFYKSLIQSQMTQSSIKTR